MTPSATRLLRSVRVEPRDPGLRRIPLAKDRTARIRAGLEQVDSWGKDEYTLGCRLGVPSPVGTQDQARVLDGGRHPRRSYEQLDDSGGIVLVPENNPWAEMEHTGLILVPAAPVQEQLELRRQLRLVGDDREPATCRGRGRECVGDPGAYIDIARSGDGRADVAAEQGRQDWTPTAST